MYNVLFYNGVYLSATDFKLDIKDRAFRYGDGLFETLFANGQQLPFFDQHMARFRYGLQLLNLNLDKVYTDAYILECMQGLLHRCRLYQGATVKLSVWRVGEGKYITDKANANLLLEAHYLNKGKFELNAVGLNVGVYEQMHKPNHALFSIKSMNALFYTIAGSFVKEQMWDDAFLVNNNGDIIEATSSNVFYVKGGIVYTPKLSLGCVHGTMRETIIKALAGLNYSIIEVDHFKPEELLNVDEVFLSNAINGVRWVIGYEKRRYLNRVAKKITQELNNLICL